MTDCKVCLWVLAAMVKASLPSFVGYLGQVTTSTKQGYKAKVRFVNLCMYGFTVLVPFQSPALSRSVPWDP